ncbi:MAG: hypothetical protein ACPG32_09460, partial [Akkermansiaceae bacterium]
VMARLPIDDSDGNGLDDTWENIHYGSTGQSATADTDLDGWSNYAESLLNTSPHQANVRSIASISSAGNTLQWPSQAGLRYYVEQSFDLIAWQRIESYLPATPPTQSWSLPATPHQEKVFYRIGFQK